MTSGNSLLLRGERECTGRGGIGGGGGREREEMVEAVGGGWGWGGGRGGGERRQLSHDEHLCVHSRLS